MTTSPNPPRQIFVSPNNWLKNIKTGKIKLAKDLSPKEMAAQEWRIINRKERRAKGKKK